MPSIKQISLVVLLSVVVMPFVVIPWWIRAFELPKVILLWSLGVSLGGAFLVQWVRCKVEWKPQGWIDLGMLIWLGAGVIAVLVSPDPFVSFFGSSERGLGFITELAAFGVFLGVRTFLSRQWLARLPCLATIWAGLIAGAGILGAWLGVRTDMIQVGGVDLPRMSGTFGHSAFLGTTLAVLLPFALTILLCPGRYTKFLGVIVVALCGIGIFGSFSRGALLGAVMGISTWSFTQWSRRRPVVPVLFAVVLILGGIFLVSSPGNVLRKRFHLDASAQIRLADWQVALKAGLRKPWGHGQETFWRASVSRPRWPGEPNDGISDRVHNLFLDELYTKGFLGLTGLVLMLWGGVRSAWRLGTPGVPFLASLMALTTALFFLFHFAVSLLVLTLLLGLLSAQSHRDTMLRLR